MVWKLNLSSSNNQQVLLVPFIYLSLKAALKKQNSLAE